MSKLIDRAALQARMVANPKLVILEALPAKYYDEGHLPGARHMPHDNVKELAPELVSDQAAEIVVYCASASCQNSHIAANRMTAMGYGNVSVYAGGKQDWSEAGLPLAATAAVA